MAGPNIYVDNNALDNGTWRRFVGSVARSMEPSGDNETLGVEFIVQGSTKAEFITRVQSTETDFVKRGSRVRFFTDTVESPLYDWSPGDTVHADTFCSVEWVIEESHTVYSARLRFFATAPRTLPTGGGGSTQTGNFFPLTGQTSEIRLTEEYSEDGTLSISASGHFAPTAANSGSPLTLTTIETDAGYARFVVTGTMPTFVAGMRIVVTGSTGYNGTHFVTAISGQKFTTKTAFAAGETGLSGAVQVQLVTSGEDNYLVARGTILTSYLGVYSTGAPDSTTGRVLLLEHLIKDSPDGLEVDFILTAGPQKFIPTSFGSGSANSSRGFDFQLSISEPEMWFPDAGPKPKLIAATGTFTVDKLVVSSTKLYSWYLLSKSDFAARVAAEAVVSSSGLKLVSTVVGIDYTMNSVKFTNVYRSNWTGVIDFSREYAYSEHLDYSAWSDADGYDVAQRPNRAIPKTCVVTTMRVGEGEADLTPTQPPSESGYTYIEVNRDAQKKGPFITEFSNNTFYQFDVRTYVRFRFKSGGGSVGMQEVNPSV